MVRKYNAFNPCINAKKVLKKYYPNCVMKLSSLEVIDHKFDDLTDSEVQLINKDLKTEFGIDRGIKQWL